VFFRASGWDPSAALVAVSIWKPALSQGPADLATVPAEVGLDWFFLPLYPLTGIWGNGAVWAFLGASSLMIGSMPWLPPLRRAKPAEIDLAHCNGCALARGVLAIQVVERLRRSDGLIPNFLRKAVLKCDELLNPN
jgi:hypothetical protein